MLSIMEGKSAESREVESSMPLTSRMPVLDVRPCRMLAAPRDEFRRHAGSLGPSIQRAEILTHGGLVMPQNRRGLAA